MNVLAVFGKALGGELPCRFGRQYIRKSENGIERGSQIVAHACEKVGFGPVGIFRLLPRQFEGGCAFGNLVFECPVQVFEVEQGLFGGRDVFFHNDNDRQPRDRIAAAMEVEPERTPAYGILDVADDMGKMVQVKGMVEKPKPEAAPSNLAVIGRYILAPTVLQNLNKIKAGSGGEIQLTDAIAAEIAQDRNVYGYRFEGQRFDCGSKSGFLRATVAFGLARDELREDLTQYLHEIVQSDKAAQ